MTDQSLTIVTYHYVRDPATSRYPRINGRTVDEFKGQLDFLCRHYAVVSTGDVIAAARGDGEPLPGNAAWLTFDDGLKDHVETVLPALQSRGLSAAFFPSARPVLDGVVLDVHKIHFILACADDTENLIVRLESEVDGLREEHHLEPTNVYREHWARQGRYDPPEIVYVKRMLQKGLPPAVRSHITDRLFRHFVSTDEAAFSAELYLSRNDISALLEAGMTIGGHGDDHAWLDQLSDEEQVVQVEATKAFLTDIGAPTDDWIMCYPHGGHDDRLRALLRRNGCRIGLTVAEEIVRIGRDDWLALPRLDTNSLPLGHG